MELLTHSSTQVIFPLAAIAVVLICATLVFTFGFNKAEQPQFDKLPLVLDDRKGTNKKRKTKEKKSPNRTNDDKSKNNDLTKKSPSKDKKEEKVKQENIEKPKPKEKTLEQKQDKKELFSEKKGKKSKQEFVAEKPIDFDEGNWKEVPKKSEKKKPKPDDTKESPAKKKKKAFQEVKSVKEDTASEEEIVEQGFSERKDSDAVARELQEQVNELQRVLHEAEMRDNAAAVPRETSSPVKIQDPVLESKDKKKKDKKKSESESTADVKTVAKQIEMPPAEPANVEKLQEATNVPVFDELGDSWTDSKAAKKGKKKVRKDQ